MTMTYRSTLVLACLLTASSAHPVRADSATGWTGCYIGANAGYGRARIEGTILESITFLTIYNDPIGHATAEGVALGGQLGCDYQSTAWVFGAQVMMDWTDLHGSHPYIGGTTPANRVNYDINYFGAATGRIGYLFQPDNLPYLKAGAAWTETNHRDTDPTFSPNNIGGTGYHGNSEFTRMGWLVGAGLEHRIREHMSLFFEYNYMDFGDEKTTIRYNDGVVNIFSFEQKMHFLGMGVNYRF